MAGLPAAGDLFVGRDAELAALSGMIAEPHSRLVTLTGPPGIGKTRLAVACAAAYAERRGRPAVFVDLAPLRDPDQVVVELARAFGVRARDQDALMGRLASVAGHEDRLVVLDNCEHLLAATPRIGEVLAGCGWLRVLATSRERLRLSAEREFPVPPLPVPSLGDVADLDALARNPSVALLVDRALRTNPRFALRGSNASSVAHACIRLEGLPLALELAAARLKVLSAGELAFRLGNRMDLLASSALDVPARQRALRSAIAWSHDLLGQAERAMFRRLSVFVDGWTLPDVESVCGGTADEVLALVGSLLDKSLVRRVPDDGQAACFAMLESLREFAAEQLAACGETAALRDRHAEHHAELAVAYEASLGLPDERVWWPRVRRHQANMQVAFDHCLATGRHREARQLAAALGWYHYTRGDLGRGRRLVDEVLSADGEAAGPIDREDAETSRTRAGVCLAGGILALGKDELDRAELLLLGALQRSARVGDERRGAVARAFLGNVARVRGAFETSADWHQQASAASSRMGNAQGVAWARYDLGLLARDRGDLDEAVGLLRQSLREFHDMGYPWAFACCGWALGTALCAQDRFEEAGPLLGEAVQVYRDVDDPRGVAQCLEALARVACERAFFESAARLLGAADAQRVRLAAPPTDADRAWTSAAEGALARALGPEAAERVRRTGRALPVGRAVDLGAAVARGTMPGEPGRGKPALLTRRERQVAALVASGRTNRQIGRALGIAEKTAEVHVHHLMTKLDVRSRVEVAAWALSHELSATWPGAVAT